MGDKIGQRIKIKNTMITIGFPIAKGGNLMMFYVKRAQIIQMSHIEHKGLLQLYHMRCIEGKSAFRHMQTVQVQISVYILSVI